MARDCKAKTDNEFAFVRFFRRAASVNLQTLPAQPFPGVMLMFAFNRSAFAVLAPLAMLLAVVLWANQSAAPAAPQQASEQAAKPNQAVAANLPSR